MGTQVSFVHGQVLMPNACCSCGGPSPTSSVKVTYGSRKVYASQGFPACGRCSGAVKLTPPDPKDYTSPENHTTDAAYDETSSKGSLFGRLFNPAAQRRRQREQETSNLLPDERQRYDAACAEHNKTLQEYRSAREAAKHAVKVVRFKKAGFTSDDLNVTVEFENATFAALFYAVNAQNLPHEKKTREKFLALNGHSPVGTKGRLKSSTPDAPGKPLWKP
jgi:hypothetical protein